MRAPWPALLTAGGFSLPLLAGGALPLEALPAGLAFALREGRWLSWIGLAAATLTVAWPDLAPRRSPRPAWRRPPFIGSRAARGAGFVACVLLALALVPGYRWSGESFGGDEPKYLRMAESLARDLDVDVAEGLERPASAAELASGARRLGRSVAAAVRGLVAPDVETLEPAWSLGNWTVAGRHGGAYHVQSPGLPALLAPALAVADRLRPGQPGGVFVLYVLCALWAGALWQTGRLAAELSGSPAAGAGAAVLACSTAPLLVAGMHVYPESAAAAAVPWCLRHVLACGPAVPRGRAAALGLVAGFLPWLHPKFVPLAGALLLGLALRLRHDRPRMGSLALGAALPLATLLLFDHHVTGLLRPDAFHRRYGSPVYTGLADFLAPRMASGLVTALFGARDGLLVMAPVLAAGLMSLPLAFRRDRRATVALVLAFASLWAAAAVHGGGAPGPPGRLLAPVACVPAALLAVGLARHRHDLRYTWTVAALALVSLTITGAMLRDWRRTVNPYRGVFVQAADFSRDLPDGAWRDERPDPARRPRDLARGLILFAVLGFWARVLSGVRPGPEPGADGWARQVLAFGAGAWSTVALGSAALAALGP
jgi:hypothetical protein